MEVEQELWLPRDYAGYRCRSDVACKPHASYLAFRFASAIADFDGTSITISLWRLCPYSSLVSAPGDCLLLVTCKVILHNPGHWAQFRVLWPVKMMIESGYIALCL